MLSMALEGFIFTYIFVYFLTISTENTLYNLDYVMFKKWKKVLKPK